MLRIIQSACTLSFFRPLVARCFVLLLLSGVNGLVEAQVRGSAAPKTDQPLTANRQLEDVFLEGETLALLLSDLADQYDIPIGLERAMNEYDHPETRIDLKRVTLGELLTQLLANYKEYSWEISDGVVRVFPKEGHRDPIVERLLNIEIEKFSIKKSSATWNVESTLLETPEFREVFDAYGLRAHGWIFSGFYLPQLGRNYSLDVSGAKVQTILNRIVKESPTAKFWCISRNSSQHTFSLNFTARPEGPPANPRRFNVKELKRLSYP